jgi:hypothetical protein
MSHYSLPHKLLSIILLCAMACSSLYAPGRALAWGEFTLKDEKELGEKFNIMIRSRLPLVQDTEIANYVKDIVDVSSAPTVSLPFVPPPSGSMIVEADLAPMTNQRSSKLSPVGCLSGGAVG